MSNPRRDFIKRLSSVAVLPGLLPSSSASDAVEALFDRDSADEVNPDFEPQAYSF